MWGGSCGESDNSDTRLPTLSPAWQPAPAPAPPPPSPSHLLGNLRQLLHLDGAAEVRIHGVEVVEQPVGLAAADRGGHETQQQPAHAALWGGNVWKGECVGWGEGGWRRPCDPTAAGACISERDPLQLPP